MKLNLRRMVASASMLAIIGGVLAGTASMASAATTPPWEPDPNALGSLTFYNSAGQVITGGTNLSHLADFVQASTTDATNGTKATLEFAAPVPSTPTGSFTTSIVSASTNFPNAAAPAPLNTSTHPVVTLAAGDANLAAFIQANTPQTAAGFANVFQVRLVTSGAGGVGTVGAGTYWEDDILVNPTTGSWSIEFPAVVTATTTTLTANPATATVGQSDTLTATESPAAAGTVDFKDGATDLGSAAVNGSGVATMATTFSTAGSHSLTATFTPTDPTSFSGSTGNLTLTVNPAATPTTTTLAVSQNGSTGSDVSMSATVLSGSTPVTAGTVSFFDNGSSTPLNSTPATPNASGVATFDIPAGLSAGSHSIIAVFTPTNVTQFESSQSAPQQFILQAPQVGACAQPGSQCTATANIEATIPVGTLVISTPYTAANPLNLGSLVANSGLTQYSGTAPLSNLQVVDTRSGDLPWTVSALASNLTDGGTHTGSTICGQNVGLTAVTSTPGAGFTGTVTTTSNPAASPAIAPSSTGCPATAGGLRGAGGTAVTVATATVGLGTDTLNGTLTLNAPISTEAGLFTGTITFTVG